MKSRRQRAKREFTAFFLLLSAFCFFLALHGLIMTGSGQWLYRESLGELKALHLCHFFGLWSFRPLRDLELDLLALF